jgi:hypothetical protein
MKGLNNLTLRGRDVRGVEKEKRLPDVDASNRRRRNSDASETKHSGDLRYNSKRPRRSDCPVQLNHAAYD